MKIETRLQILSHAIAGKQDAALIESIISLFNSGVLEYRLTSPRMSFDKDNFKMTVEQSSSVVFAGRDKIVQLEKELAECRDKMEKMSKSLAAASAILGFPE